MNSAHSFISSSSLVALFLVTLVIHANWIDETIPRSIVQTVQFGLGECGPKAVLDNGRYYYRDNIRYVNESTDIIEPMTTIIDFNDQLNEQGIRLIIVPVPSKVSAIYQNPTNMLIKELQNKNINVINLYPFLCEQHYLNSDTHWNTDGIRVAAEKIASNLGFSDNMTGKKIELNRDGDIISMMDNPIIEQIVGPEQTTCEQFELTDGGEVLFIGDSYLRIFEQDEPGGAGLISHVGSYLGYRPKSIINDGGGSTLVRQRLASEPTLLLGIRTVVWVFADRDIRFGIDGWQRVIIKPRKQDVGDILEKRL